MPYHPASQYHRGIHHVELWLYTHHTPALEGPNINGSNRQNSINISVDILELRCSEIRVAV